MSVETCPLCGGSTKPAFTVGDRNREITRAQFHYRRCTRCGTLYLSDVPADLAAYYPDAYYDVPSLEELDAGAEAERAKLELIRRYAGVGRLVDVGASFGLFARAADRAGFDVTAVEMDARCCRHLEQVVGVRAIHSDEPEQALAGLDGVQVITLWHVLEHLPRPGQVLEAAVESLDRAGALVVAMPNPASVQFRLMRARWPHVDAPRHLFLIPLAALQAQATRVGLDLAYATTSDPAGRYWNYFGWEYMLRRTPARTAPSALHRALARALTLTLAPIERRGMNGAAYTALFVKP